MKAEVSLTKVQRQLMEHAISGSNRNWFGTDRENKDGQEFEKLVEMGLATSEKPPSWMGDNVIYRLTAKGKEVLK